MRALLVLGVIALIGCQRNKPPTDILEPQLSPGEFIAHTPGGIGFGHWGGKTYCPAGTHAVGFNLKIEGSCGGDCDDTALNTIQLQCSDGKGGPSTAVESGLQPWGSWRQPQLCPQGQALYAYSLGFEHHLGKGGDDTSANSLKMRCRTVGTYDKPEAELAIHGPFADTWTTWTSCPVNSVVIGLLTQNEPSQGNGDDTATNDVMFVCARRRI